MPVGCFGSARSKLRLGMKLSQIRFLVLAGALAAALGVAGAAESEKSAEKPTETPRRDGLTLDAEARARIGLATRPLVATNLPAETVAYGTVLDPSPLALLDTELRGAAAALAIARIQQEREQTLFAQNQIVARPALETAMLQVQTAETRHETALRRLATEWGEPFLELDSTNRHALIARLVRRESILIRAELPAGENLTNPPKQARVTTVGADHDRTAAWFCEAPTVDARTQGRAFLFQAPGPDTGLRPGAAVSVFLAQDAAAKAGTLLPREAVIRYQGQSWVYLAGAEDHFRRAAVSLDRLTEAGWFTATLLPEGAPVVTTGAAILLSEELKAQLTAD